MSFKEIQIVSFDNPYPPNFGGVIDVFYKVKALSNKGLKVYLHYFYTDRTDEGPLLDLCEKVYAYKRDTSLLNFLSLLPYRIKSRISNQLYDNLILIDAPILFEGLHTTSVLLNHHFENQLYLRAHNIEHEYTLGLAKGEKNYFKKVAHYLEASKLNRYQSILVKMNKIFVLSKNDFKYFSNTFMIDIEYIPVFHGNDDLVGCHTAIEENKYALYHGDLSSASNIESVKFLIKIFKKLKYPLLIASSTQSKEINKLIRKINNCSFQELKSNRELDKLIQNAQVNVLYSNHRSGTKLKVFNALYKGRHIIINDNIVDDISIMELCTIANTEKEFIRKIDLAFNTDYVQTQERIEILKDFTADVVVEKLLNEIRYV